MNRAGGAGGQPMGYGRSANPQAGLKAVIVVQIALGRFWEEITHAIQNSRLVSPPIDLCPDASYIYVRWWHWFSWFNEPNTSDDRGQIQIQTWEGDHWSDWQTLYELFFSSSDWTLGQADLIAYAGKRVRIGFNHVDYYSYYGGESSGWYIDDFEILDDCDGPTCSDLAQLEISPSSGYYGTTQDFDLMLLFIPSEGCSVVDMSATFDGNDVTAFLESCFIPGTLAIGGETYRCPDISGYINPGGYTFSVTLEFNDDSTVNDTVRWNILSNTEP